MEMMPQRKQPPPPSPEPVTPSPIKDDPFRSVENVAPYTPGGATIKDRKKYNEYLVGQGGSGGKPLSFQEWLAAGKP